METDQTVEQASPQSTSSSEEDQVYTLEFKGTAGEYFKIWIVNIALTLVTLGIYSAWAKVRTRKYFDNHTFLNGASFDYHGDPVKILKGRILMCALLAAYSLGGKISPAISLVAFLLFIGIFPWVVVKSMAFNLGNTSYRGLRFGFQGPVNESYRTYALSYAITFFTLGLGYPVAAAMTKRFQVNNSRFGTSLFSLSLHSNGSFYKVYGKAFVSYFIFAIPLAVLSFIAIKTAQPSESLKIMTGLAIGITVYLAAIASSSLYFAGMFNLLSSATRLSDLKFSSRKSDLNLASIYFVNALACIFSIGLLYPWTKVRMLKAKLAALEVKGPVTALDSFQAGTANASGASGDAAADFLNLDLDMGF